MSKNTIVQISDLHISRENVSRIQEVLLPLIDDIKRNTEKVDLVICSGDLVQSGTKENFDLAFSKFVSPLLNAIGVDEANFIYVPGNHEVDISKIDSDFSIQFTKRILEQGLNKEDLKKSNVTDRLATFFEYINLFYDWNQSNLIKTRCLTVNGVKYGITLVNTAWNTAGNSPNEAKKILISREELVNSLSEVEHCDRKILVMHHPIDWFEDDNADKIEQLFSKYDYVLTGHKHHERGNIYLHMNGVTLFNSASKIDTSKGENGYTIIIRDTTLSKIQLKCRTYIKGRLSYAPDTRVSDDGMTEIPIGKKDDVNQIISDVIINSRKNFNTSLNELFITNLLETSKNQTFEQLFVMPTIKRYSEFSKERTDDSEEDAKFELKDALLEDKFLTFWGRKEIGKTIFAHYIAKFLYDNYIDFQKVPIVLDCRHFSNGKNIIFNSINRKINDLLDNNYSISKADIEKIALQGSFIVILDNYEISDKVELQVKQFVQDYPNNKIIFLRNETPGVFSDEDKLALLAEEVKEDTSNYFIRSMDKHRIRLLAQNMSSINPSIEDSYVDKIVYSFSTNNMPRTPFAVSLVLAICSETSDYLPTNQSKIVESFMEKLLEKLNPSEVLSKTYHFGNKERFLAALAFEMYNNNSYYLTREQFDEFTKKYHIDKGYELKESRFDIIFFEKGLLVEYDSKIFFKYECLNYYYMAKYCFFNRAFFYENILTKEQFIKNVDIISYYAGLSLEDKKMIDRIIEFIQPYLDKHSDVGNLFDVDSIKLQLGIPDEEIKKVIEENGQVSAEEKDKLTDVPDKSNNYKPLSIKAETHFSEEMSFGVAIELLGDVIRSSEELLFSDKKPAFEKYLSGCIILWTQFRHSLLSFAQKINEELIVKKKAEEGCNYDDIKDALNKAYSNFCDIIKLSVPIAMSGFIFNCVGSEKMKVVFQDYYNSCSNDSPEKLLMLMLICDLKMPSWEKYLNEYIKQTKKKDFLWVMFFKCQYYYQFNYFGDATKKIINPLADCYIAANGNSKRKKSELIGIIQSTKRHLLD